MRGKDYFGLATGENALYKTLDNGKTWEIITQGGFNLESDDVSSSDGDTPKKDNGRMIFASTENKGLLYSDDFGITRNESNIRTGNFGFVTWDDEKRYAYAVSLDGNGIFVTKNEGEFWEDTNVLFGDWNTVWKQEDGIHFGSNSGAVLFDLVNPNIGKFYSLGSVVTSNNTFSTMKIPADIVPVINKVVAPQIFAEVTGEKFKSDANDLDLLIKDSSQLFISENDLFEKSIDWENDVGMKPFFQKISDFFQKDENYIISDVKNNDSATMKKTMQKVKRFVEARKKNAITNMVKRISACQVNTDNITEVENATQEEKFQAIQAERMLENVLKASVMTVMGNSYNRIFSFNDAMIRKLIYSGVYETIIIIAGDISKQLNAIKSSGKTTVTKKDFSIKYDFSKGLNVALEKYLKNMSKRITILNNSEDKDLISVAADFYKSNKTDYIFQANAILNNITFDVFDESKTSLDGEKVLKFLYNKFLKKFQDDLTINFNYFTLEELQEYSLGEREKIFKYLNTIYDKFKERCFDYTKYIFEYKFDKDLAIKNFDDILKNISDKNTALQTCENFFLKIFKANWAESKELI